MVHRLLTGSPLGKLITGPNRSRFFSKVSALTLTALESVAMRKLAPRAFEAHGIPASTFSVTARVYLCPATWGDLAVQTTCSIIDGGKPSKLWTEYAWLSESLVSALLTSLNAAPIRDAGNLTRSYLVLTSQKISEQEVMRKHAHLFDTWQQSAFRAANVG